MAESDFKDLASLPFDGRQIRNLVRSAQALAMHEMVPHNMAHLRTVIGIAASFEVDLKDGMSLEDAMRSETQSQLCS